MAGNSDEFNYYLVNSVASSVNINSPSDRFNAKRQLNSILLYPVNNIEMVHIIKSLINKSSTSFDNFSVEVIKPLSNLIAIPRTRLVHFSFAVERFPSLFKKALLPIFKNGHESINHYKPATLFLFFLKSLRELCAWDYLNLNNFFCKPQFGVRKGRCTEDVVSKQMRAVYVNINNSDLVSVLFIDFSKTFHLVRQDILVQKL